MNFFDYIVSSSPEEALAIFAKYSPSEVTTQRDLSKGIRHVLNTLESDQKRMFLTELAEIHPDREMISDLISNPEVEVDDHKNCNSCQMKLSANGTNAVSHYLSSGDVKQLIGSEQSVLSKELNDLKHENSTKKYLNDAVFKLIILGVIGYLLYTTLNKK